MLLIIKYFSNFIRWCDTGMEYEEAGQHNLITYRWRIDMMTDDEVIYHQNKFFYFLFKI
jgi:hypothetical protein